MTGSIAYLGPEGTFSEVAAREVGGGSDGELVACSGVVEVLRAVESGDAGRGVVPIENTLEGAVTATLDALAFESELLIEAELELPIVLVLAARPGTTLAAVREVLTHPVPLAGCGRWLSEHLPAAERRPVASTARAAQEVGTRGQGAAAIVNPLAAARYGLEVLATDLADVAGNTTRFVVVGRTLAAPTGWDKTSLVVYIHRSRPGALLHLLEIFAERDLDLTKIESRPTKHELGDYCFFLDVEGHLAEERVGDALAAVKRTQRDVKVLGSYPRLGEPPAGRDHGVRSDAAYRDAAAWVASWRERIAR